MAKDCDEFNMKRVKQLMDCATKEEKNCLMKMFAYQLVIDLAKDVLEEKVKLTTPEGAERLMSKVAVFICSLANEYSVETTGNPIFHFDIE